MTDNIRDLAAARARAEAGPSFDSLKGKLYRHVDNLLDRDAQEVAELEPGERTPDCYSRRVHRYSTSIVALEKAAHLKDEHGEGCECQRCVDALATVERALDDYVNSKRNGKK